MAPLGTRLKRRALHQAFDRIWKLKLMNRDEAYHWLANQLSIDYNACHISMLADHQLDAAIPICNSYVDNWHIVAKRRVKKKNEQFAKQQQRGLNRRNSRLSR
jgi:hypothetical protein